jgi:hypothetical protein
MISSSYISLYINKIEEYLQNGYELNQIAYLDSFQRFRKNNLISFGEAAEVDAYFFGTSGNYWMSAFNYPKNNDILLIQNEEYIAKNVGILTFKIY